MMIFIDLISFSLNIETIYYVLNKKKKEIIRITGMTIL